MSANEPKQELANLRAAVLSGMLQMAAALKEVATAAKEGKSLKRNIGGEKDARKRKLVDSAISLFMSQSLADASKENV